MFHLRKGLHIRSFEIYAFAHDRVRLSGGDPVLYIGH